jgi:hypothetical protein
LHRFCTLHSLLQSERPQRLAKNCATTTTTTTNKLEAAVIYNKSSPTYNELKELIKAIAIDLRISRTLYTEMNAKNQQSSSTDL